MKYIELDKEEQEILADYEADKYTSVREDQKRFVGIAKATLNKTKNVNIRVPEKDILKIKAKAAKSGIPYQTLMASIMHRYAQGEVKIEL